MYVRCQTRENLRCRRRGRSKLQANAAESVGVPSRLNTEQHLSLVNLVISRQKIFANHQNEKMHEKSLPILAEQLDAK